MFQPLSFAIGLRYLRAKRRNGFISFISMASILGILIGLAVVFRKTLRALLSGDPPSIALRKQFPGELGAGSFDDDDVIDDYVLTVTVVAPFCGGMASASPIALNGAWTFTSLSKKDFNEK